MVAGRYQQVVPVKLYFHLGTGLPGQVIGILAYLDTKVHHITVKDPGEIFGQHQLHSPIFEDLGRYLS